VITDLHYESKGLLVVNAFLSYSCNSMPQLRYTVKQCVFLVHLYFKSESAGKCHRKFLISGDECVKNVCTKGHKSVTTATM